MLYQDKLLEIAEKNPNVMVLTAENRASIRNITDKLDGRFLDTGITEQTLIGASAGLALRGRIPVVHALATFLTMRAYEFIRTDVGIANLPVKIVGAVPGFLSEANGPTHQAVEDIALMRTMPNMDIFCPADRDDLLNGIETIINSPNPTYIRYNDLTPVVNHDSLKPSQAEIFGTGHDVTIFTYGFMFNQAFWASEILTSKGIGTRVVNLRMLNPVDKNLIYRLCKESSLTVTIEDHFIQSGLYTIIAETLLQHNYTCSVLPIALKNKWFKPALINDVLKFEEMLPNDLANKIENYLNRVKNEYYTEWSSV